MVNTVKSYWTASRLNAHLRSDNPKPKRFQKEKIELLFDEEYEEISVEFRIVMFGLFTVYRKVYFFTY